MTGSTTDKWIFWLEEVSKHDCNLVGKKCANLGELTRSGFRVPQGFALSVDAYDRFLHSSGLLDEITQFLKGLDADPHDPAEITKYDDASRAIRGIVESKTMPADIEGTVARYYDDLCARTGIGDVPVATRSAGPISHPGQYETYLYVRGTAAVMQNIIKVWSSTFNARSLLARARAGLSLSYDPIGVAVLQMVNAKAAGVMFTLNPMNGDRSKIMIEGNWGLGESVVSGSVTPDEWMVDKVVLEIIKRTTSPKGVEYTVDRNLGQVMAVEIPSERQSIPCLSDQEVIELARVSKLIERHYGVPQDIEWAIDKDLPFPQNVFFVQTRAETVWSGQKAASKLQTSGSSAADVVSFYQNLKA